MRPKTPPRRLKTASRGAQDAPKTTQGFQDGPRTAPRRAQNGSRTFQDVPRTVQVAPLGPTKIQYFLHFSNVGFLVGLWWVFGGSLVPPPNTHKLQHTKNKKILIFYVA